MAWSFALPPGARLAEPQRRQASLFRAVRQNFGFTEPPEPLVLVGKLGNAGNGVQNSLFFFVKKKSLGKRKSFYSKTYNPLHCKGLAVCPTAAGLRRTQGMGFEPMLP
ncbi:hypothetical protein A2118_03435 [Candidatus Kaiserbacteria bacterium GWA2_50_9]|uniref:Uncharacterized protein n=1 Tax=Candidatus Kaiserbacteria bacterium GWA2_50_9 TaxID=1798474 RepID=A0A1F6BWB3_9BACT|nr:MAG: hypothetical protein A2118_03435 [Candidatus Kaiserbacteria bacterium GWA2_50_9]